MVSLQGSFAPTPDIISASFTAAGGDISVTDVTLTRAASKINLNVSFDPVFLERLGSEKHWTLCGEPHWRFYNFAFSAPVFSNLSQSATYDPKVSWFTSGADMMGYDGIAGNDLVFDRSHVDDESSASNKRDYPFSFSTYSYPLSWTAETAGEEAPAIIVSVGYRDD